VTGGTSGLNDTHDPDLRSWVEGAHAPAGDFPIQNLPFGVFRHDPEDAPRVGIAIGDHILDCLAAAQAGRFDALDPSVRAALQASSLNPLMALGRGAARSVRGVASRMLRSHTPEGAAARDMRDAILVGKNHVELLVPANIGDYTDFYASDRKSVV
jgi:fumarylacetoacetase